MKSYKDLPREVVLNAPDGADGGSLCPCPTSKSPGRRRLQQWPKKLQRCFMSLKMILICANAGIKIMLLTLTRGSAHVTNALKKRLEKILILPRLGYQVECRYSYVCAGTIRYPNFNKIIRCQRYDGLSRNILCASCCVQC